MGCLPAFASFVRSFNSYANRTSFLLFVVVVRCWVSDALMDRCVCACAACPYTSFALLETDKTRGASDKYPCSCVCVSVSAVSP